MARNRNVACELQCCVHGRAVHTIFDDTVPIDAYLKNAWLRLSGTSRIASLAPVSASDSKPHVSV